VHCGKFYEDASKELITGCSGCKSHFFFYVKKEQLEELQRKTIELTTLDKEKIEKDVREIIGIEEESEIPVILDLESVRVMGHGKFEIDIVNLFSHKRPLIYKLEEGKYVIDLASIIKAPMDEINKKIKDPSS
jgi:predicted  nucleic acid-binding Zn-ribbon protein